MELLLTGNPITSFDPTYELPNTLLTLALDRCQLTHFAPTHPLPASLYTIQLQGNLLTQTEINNTLIYLDGLTFNPGGKSLLISQPGLPQPSGAGLTAKSSLIAKGWIIQTF
jgi:hypothetical protein